MILGACEDAEEGAFAVFLIVLEKTRDTIASISKATQNGDRVIKKFCILKILLKAYSEDSSDPENLN